MIVLKGKAKIITAVLVFCVLVAAGFAVERFERDAFVMETTAVDDAPDYKAEGEAVIDGKVNINAAGTDELIQLYGIGSAMAERIVEYRSEHGAFASVEDIMKVSGISEKKFESIKDSICAE